MEIKIIKERIKRTELADIAKKQFGDLVKAVVDLEKDIMAVGPEFHSDGEAALMEREDSKREYTWGVNLYPQKQGEEWIEFDSVINIKPFFGNRSRDVEDLETKEKIKNIVNKLVD